MPLPARSENALKDHTITPVVDSDILAAIAVSGMLLTLFHTPFFATLGFLGLVNAIYKKCAAPRRRSRQCATAPHSSPAPGTAPCQRILCALHLQRVPSSEGLR